MNKKNKIIVIGFCGQKRCYLNLSPEQALKRYIEKEGPVDNLKTVSDYKNRGILKIYEFVDEFEAFDIYGKNLNQKIKNGKNRQNIS